MESASPPDIVPTNTGEPVADALEIQMPAEPPATNAMSGEQSVLSASRVEPLEPTIPKHLETSTIASSTLFDSSQSNPHRAAAPLAAESTSATQQDPLMDAPRQLEPQPAPPKATLSDIANDNAEDPQPAANQIDHSLHDELDDYYYLEAGSIPDQKPPLQREPDAMQPIQDLTSTTVLPSPDLVQTPDSPGEPQLDTASPDEPIVAMAPDMEQDDFAQSMPADAQAADVQDEEFLTPLGEERPEYPQPLNFDVPMPPTPPVAPESQTPEPVEPADIAAPPSDGEPVEETPSEQQVEPPSLPDIDNDLENPPTDEPLDAPEDQPIPQELPEAPPVQTEPLADETSEEHTVQMERPADEVSEERTVESATVPVVFSQDEMPEAPIAFPEMPPSHQESHHPEEEAVDNDQAQRHETREENGFLPEAVQGAPQNDAKVHWQENHQEKLDQESSEQEIRRKEETRAKELLKELKQKIHMKQARDEAEADGAAEQSHEEANTRTEAQEASETKQQEGAIRERIERETLEQVTEAKRLLALMEQEIRATEAQDEIEKAALAERAKRENEQLEYKQMQRERMEQRRRDMEARMAASGTTSAQKEADQVEAARKAIEEASRARGPNGVGSRPMASSPAQERWPGDELPRARTPPSAGYRAHDRSPSQSDRPFRSFRSFAPHARKLRTQEAGPNYPPKPYSVSHFLEDDIPAAPSPPMSRVRPRYVVQSLFPLFSSHVVRLFSGQHHFTVRTVM